MNSAREQRLLESIPTGLLIGGQWRDSASGNRFAVEDPATGTAAGPLAASLTRHGDVPGDRPVLIQQGDATGRPSRLRVDVDGDRVRITGTGLVVGSGRLTVRAG